ncbi:MULTISPECIES: hypothetical protein [Micrococcaceae]|uniref:hypothetical protein n=1 Tax=Micrococcaceae TaxID=1268 RepID=UPI00161BF248|nr:MULTISPECIES: hypothetical protein [Micrococcaceae]MBB5749274.1 hypothetical protein [Micrococcus sp. TA1]HRO30236.1 hypothetical protein [Citricoccus sp.]HRO93145.1 hypothetical protein [Citricoccus sp.]
MPQTTSSHTPVRRRFRALGITALGAAAALTLSSCGTSAPALEDVWPEVSQSIQNAKSVAIEGNVTQGGQDMSVAMSGQIDDSSYSGSVSMGDAQVEVIGNAEKTYLKPNGAFYQEMGGAGLQELVGEKWLEMPAEDGGFTMSSFWSSVSEDIPGSDQFQDSEYTSEVVEHNGEEVYKYSGTSAENGEPVAIYITQENRLVRVEVDQAGQGEGGSADASTPASPQASASPDAGTGTVDFSDWDAVEPVDMPAKDEVFAVPGM